MIVQSDYGRFAGRLAFAFAFALAGRFAFEFMFEFVFIGAGVDATVGAGVGVLRFTFALFTVLFAAPPHAAPSVPTERTAASAIFFIIPD